MKNKMFIGCYNKSVILTYIGVAVAIFPFSIKNIKVSIICLIIAGLCDLFDGPIARKCKNRTDTEKAFGIQIDSLADVCISLILPSYILISLNIKYNQINIWVTYLVCIIYILAGITRLGYFNIITKIDEPTKVYKGLPVTYAALVIPVTYLFLAGAYIDAIVIGLVVAYLILALAFVLNIEYKKPSKIMCIVFVLLAIIVSIGVVIV